VTFRRATFDDVPALHALISASARGLSGHDYTSAQIEASLHSAWAVDTQLIVDQTYFVTATPAVIACGGWSWRKTLFGGDGHEGREPEALDPLVDAARIRAFFVHPHHARRGIARALLRLCESEARQRGFSSAELIATLSGKRLYEACGYLAAEAREYVLPNGEAILFVPMRKCLKAEGPSVEGFQ
jgi:GNAT superfamily N-acetyltransferase